jgi:hypothetical protein
VGMLGASMTLSAVLGQLLAQEYRALAEDAQ